MSEVTMPARRILIADDSATMRRLVRGILEYRGYQVIEAATGGEAIQAIQTQKPHLAILDLRMPDVDGLEVVRHLRAAEAGSGASGRSLPVIILTAEEDEAERARGVGASRFLVKPFEPVELLRIVGELLVDG